MKKGIIGKMINEIKFLKKIIKEYEFEVGYCDYDSGRASGIDEICNILKERLERIERFTIKQDGEKYEFRCWRCDSIIRFCKPMVICKRCFMVLDSKNFLKDNPVRENPRIAWTKQEAIQLEKEKWKGETVVLEKAK